MTSPPRPLKHSITGIQNTLTSKNLKCNATIIHSSVKVSSVLSLAIVESEQVIFFDTAILFHLKANQISKKVVQLIRESNYSNSFS